MEAAQTKHTSETASEQGAHFPGAREALRGIARRRIERRGRQMARNVRGRVRAFGRGARLGYAIQEHPGRAVAFGFAIGCAVGVIGLAVSQMVQDFQQLLEEEAPAEETQSETEGVAA